MTETYKVGDRNVPEWCKITPYRKLDGTTGYELYGKSRNFIVSIGDEITKSENRILVRRKLVNGRKEISSTGTET